MHSCTCSTAEDRETFAHDPDWVGRHEAAYRTRVITRPEVIQAGLAIAFFADELV